MSKSSWALKEQIKEEQENVSAISGEELPEELFLSDIDRIIQGSEGGEYVPDNVRVMTPKEHMKRHGNLRVRSEEDSYIKSLIDHRNNLIKSVNGINNRRLAIDRQTDDFHEDSFNFFTESITPFKKEFNKNTSLIKKQMDKIRKTDKLIDSALNVYGVGEVTCAYMKAYIILDPNDPYYKELRKGKTFRKPPMHPSSLWKYVGYDTPSHKRHVKGVAGGGNESLRCQLYNMGCSFIKCRNSYRDVYDRMREIYKVSEKFTEERRRTKSGRWEMQEIMWKDASLLHQYMSALRVMNKHFLADWWMVGWTFLGLDTSRGLYVKEKLGHTNIISPRERGWVY